MRWLSDLYFKRYTSIIYILTPNKKEGKQKGSRWVMDTSKFCLRTHLRNTPNQTPTHTQHFVRILFPLDFVSSYYCIVYKYCILA